MDSAAEGLATHKHCGLVLTTPSPCNGSMTEFTLQRVAAKLGLVVGIDW
jgi:hypothetical protein